MTTLYYYDREDIYKMILMSKQTRCGIYWFDCSLISKKGDKKDQGFWLERSCFSQKRFWTQKDLSYFLATLALPKLFLDDWIELNNRFLEDNGDLLNKNLKDLVGPNTVSDIIDIYLIDKDYFYSI